MAKNDRSAIAKRAKPWESRYGDVTPEELRRRADELKSLADQVRKLADRMDKGELDKVTVDSFTKWFRGVELLEESIQSIRGALLPHLTDV